MKFQRRLTVAGKSPFEGIKFAKRKSEIRNPDGTLVFMAEDVMVPADWSQVAVDVLVQKYFRKAGVPRKLKRVNESGVPEWLQRSEADEAALRELSEGQRTGMEEDARQVFERLAGCWTYWGFKHGYFDTEDDARTFFDELCYMLARQIAAPNSPQWFNTGLYWAYGINGPSQGHYFVDPVTGETRRSEDAYSHPQPHACFIQGVSDDLVNEGGIMDLWTREARLFKYGSGTGTNFSCLRAEGEPLSGGGRSSGLMSFLKIGDRAAGAIKSGGTTRRAAKMVTLDVDHPDIVEFIEWKMTEEQKVAALVAGSRTCKRALKSLLEACWSHGEEPVTSPKDNAELKAAIKEAMKMSIPQSYISRVLQLAEQGYREIDIPQYDVNWESEAYTTVSGQNSNNSVRIPNAFMRALHNGEDWSLITRTGAEVAATIPAETLWKKIGYSAWQSADPGLQFDSTINEWHTCPVDGRINASNPCSEYMFLDDTACNLASMNLMKFLNLKTNRFDVEGFRQTCRIWTVVLEISVMMAQFPSQEIARKSYEYRTLGLGYANLGAILMVSGIPYHSHRACAVTGAITAMMTGVCYQTSAEMAKELGVFPAYKRNKDHMLRIIRNHHRAVFNADEREYEQLEVKPQGIDSSHCPAYLLEAAREAWNGALEAGEKHGFRNAQMTVLAPTGTIGLVMDCDTTGIEPDFALVKFKKLAGGGYFKIINSSVPVALKNLGYSGDQIQRIKEYCRGRGTLRGAPAINHESLQAKGFTSKMLERIEESLASVFDIKFALTPFSLGESFLVDTLGIPKERLQHVDFDLLSHLGFSAKEIRLANDYCCGTMTVEGAPDLKTEHYPVFDCANRCGQIGQRFIPFEGHLNIMAAAQPFLSGAISKTINMPREATVDAIERVFHRAWELGLKAIAVYRDGSKLSQPLSILVDELEEADMEDRDETSEQTNGGVLDKAQNMVRAYRAYREPLPNRRHGYTQKVVVGGHKLYLRTGEYPDGRLGEIFLDMHREGAAFRSLMNCFAIAVSLGLQYGVPLEEYLDAFVFTKFEPSGPVSGHDYIKFSDSVIDFVFRELGLAYLARNEYAHVPVENGEKEKQESSEMDETDREFSEMIMRTKAEVDPSIQGMKMAVSHRYREARLKGYEGDPCPECGNLTLLRNGTCLKCDTCGATTGCS